MSSRISYSPELAERILAELRAGRTVEEICRGEGMPCRNTVFEWARLDHEGFGARYRAARQIGHSSPGYIDYTPEVADRVLEGLMAGRTLTEVCSDPTMPCTTTVNKWVATDREGFDARYRAARQAGELSQSEVPYSADIARRILHALARGVPLEDICADPDMPSTGSVHGWRREDPDGFGARYAEAREHGLDAIAFGALAIVDDRRNDWITCRRDDGSLTTILDPERVARAALRLKARSMLLARWQPQRGSAKAEKGGATAAEMAELMRLIGENDDPLPGASEPLDEE
jgi:hypothetical protein